MRAVRDEPPNTVRALAVAASSLAAIVLSVVLIPAGGDEEPPRATSPIVPIPSAEPSARVKGTTARAPEPADAGDGTSQEPRVEGARARRPSVPTITRTPSDPSPSPDVSFAWTGEGGATFECAIDHGDWHACASPYAFSVDSAAGETHRFSVRAVDPAGPRSQAATARFKVSKWRFAITGSVEALAPGVWRPISIRLDNPNKHAIDIVALTVAVSGGPLGCAAAGNIELAQSPLSSIRTVSVPARGAITLAVADAPRMRLLDLPVNQDACKGAAFALAFGGSALR